MWCLRCEHPRPCDAHDRGVLVVAARHADLVPALQRVMSETGVRIIRDRRRAGLLRRSEPHRFP
jgi:hypothetical protein